MGNENREGVEIDIQKLFLAYLHKWWIFVICIVLAGAIAVAYTVNFITPLYKSSVTIYVNNAGRDQKVEYITNSNLQTSQRLVNTYVYIIGSESVLGKVAQEANLDMSAREIRACMHAAQKGTTEIFDVTITHPDPVKAARIANAVAEVAPGEIERFVEGSSTKIIDYAKVPQTPASPNVAKNALVGCLIGIMVAVAYVTIRFLLDVRIKDEDDLIALFDIPVLGQIPNFLPEGSKGSKGSKVRSAYEKKNVYAQENGGEAK